MKTFLDCIPCFVRQALDASRLVSGDEVVHEEVLRQVLRHVSEMDFRDPPPAMGRRIHRTIRAVLNDPDPYREIKDRFTRLALRLYPVLKRRIRESSDSLAAAVRLAIAGNVIDFGPRSDLMESDIQRSIEEALTVPMEADIDGFRRAVARSTGILYLADNAGEIVFDRLLIEELPRDRVTVAVRGSPTINDATMEDARAAGIDRVVEVIDNGSDVPGTILADTSVGFRRFFGSPVIGVGGQIGENQG